ncbi:hypothetical protein Gotur_006033, partial [Gossypium turneri]
MKNSSEGSRGNSKRSRGCSEESRAEQKVRRTPTTAS